MTHETISAPAPKPVVDVGPRCWDCKKKLAERLTRPWEIRCVRCKAWNARRG